MQTEIEHIRALLNDLELDALLYLEMYGPEKSVATLNRVNGFVFGRLQFCLVDRLLLGVARMMDPASSKMSKDIKYNLSLKYFIEETKLDDDPDIQKRYEEIEKTYSNSRIKSYRNEIISHNDRNAIVDYTKTNVAITPNELIALIRQMMDLVGEIARKKGWTLKVSLPNYPAGQGGRALVEKFEKYV